MATATETASAMATAGGDTKTAVMATQRWRQQQHKGGSKGDTKRAVTALATATVITAMRSTTKTTTRIGKRRGGDNATSELMEQ